MQTTTFETTRFRAPRLLRDRSREHSREYFWRFPCFGISSMSTYTQLLPLLLIPLVTRQATHSDTSFRGSPRTVSRAPPCEALLFFLETQVSGTPRHEMLFLVTNPCANWYHGQNRYRPQLILRQLPSDTKLVLTKNYSEIMIF